MKSLKITLILVAVFCLTIAGTSTKKETEPTTVETIKKVNQNEVEYIAEVIKKNNKPGQEI